MKENLVIVGGGKELPYLKNKYKRNNIYFIDPLPPWKIPKIIKGVKSLIIPEYNFGIKQHMSRIPLESIICGKVPIVSDQICFKYGEMQKYFIKIKTTNKEKFVSIIKNKNLLEEKEQKINENYKEIKNKIGNFEKYLMEVESFFYNLKNNPRN